MKEITAFFGSLDLKVYLAFSIVIALYILRLILHRIINNKVTDIKSRYKWRQFVNYFLLVLALLLTVRIWFEWIQSVLTIISLIVAALTIVNKEIILNCTAYFVLVWRELFHLNDRIEVGTMRGDVIQKGIMYITVAEVGGNGFHSDARTGRIVKIPNALCLTQNVANFSRTQSVVWHEVQFAFSLKTDMRILAPKAKLLLAEYAYKPTSQEWKTISGSEEEIVFYVKEPEYFFDIKEKTLLLTLRLPLKYYQRREVTSSIVQEISLFVAENEGVEFAV